MIKNIQEQMLSALIACPVEPIAWLLGPNEYISLREALHSYHQVYFHPIEYYNKPVRLTSVPGIYFEYNKKDIDVLLNKK